MTRGFAGRLPAQGIGQEDHGRHAHATADEQGPGPFGMELEGLADGPDGADDIPGAAPGQEPGALPDRLVEDLDPARPGVDAHQGDGPAQRQGRVAGEVDKLAGLGTLGALRGREAHQVLVAGEGVLAEDLGVLDKEGAALGGVRSCMGSPGARGRCGPRAGSRSRAPSSGRPGRGCCGPDCARSRGRSATGPRGRRRRHPPSGRRPGCPGAGRGWRRGRW